MHSMFKLADRLDMGKEVVVYTKLDNNIGYTGKM